MTAINGWTLFMVLTSDPFDDRRFDRSVWLAMHGSQDRDNPRGPMARDVQRILLEAKMSRAQVREMLGSPDGHETPSLWQYTLGMWSGFRIDYDSLDVHFDDRGRATKVRVVQH